MTFSEISLRNSILPVLWICFFLSSCRKDVPAGQLIQADGFVIDSVKNKKLPNVTIYLLGARQTFYGVYYTDAVDSTLSDNDGNFSIKYRANGKSLDYALTLRHPGRIYNNTSSVEDLTHAIYPFNYTYQLSGVAVLARELNFVRINLKVQSNPYDTLYIDINSMEGALFSQYPIIGKTVDTSFLARFLPNTMNSIQYQILAVSLLDSGNAFIRNITDTLAATSADTIVVSKTINSTYDIPVKPY